MIAIGLLNLIDTRMIIECDVVELSIIECDVVELSIPSATCRG